MNGLHVFGIEAPGNWAPLQFQEPSQCKRGLNALQICEIGYSELVGWNGVFVRSIAR